jgi:hypothetical protein
MAARQHWCACRRARSRIRRAPDTNVGDAVVETITIPTTNLVVGDNVLVVSVHQQSGNPQSATTGSSDIVFGMKLDAVITTISGSIPVTLNEVLPINATLQNPDSSFAGWIELHNSGATPINIADMSLSNDVAVPRKFIFAPGTMVPGSGYLTVQCDGSLPASATNTGFSLGGSGGVIALYHKLVNGGGLHDSVAHGRQIADFSIGRSPDGSGPWSLCVPTRNALNTAAGLAPLSGVKINEWLAAPAVGADFFELYNTGAQPVALGGNYLTDVLTNRTKHLIPALSFIGAGAARWQKWIADNNNAGTPEHVNFELNATTGEALGLYTPDGTALDSLGFGPQSVGQSSGRYPDGSGIILVLAPTPGAPNQLPSPPDTDGDGIPDAWETAYGLDPGDPGDASEDADGDGQTNLREYYAGTDPNDPESVFESSVARVGGDVVIRFIAEANKSYTVQFKNSLAEPTWQKLLDIASDPAPRNLEVVDPGAAGHPTRFYHVVTPIQP